MDVKIERLNDYNIMFSKGHHMNNNKYTIFKEKKRERKRLDLNNLRYRKYHTTIY